jgi:hypothetical protein
MGCWISWLLSSGSNRTSRPSGNYLYITEHSFVHFTVSGWFLRSSGFGGAVRLCYSTALEGRGGMGPETSLRYPFKVTLGLLYLKPSTLLGPKWHSPIGSMPVHRAKKVSISRAQTPLTCLRNGCCPHQKHYPRGRINHRCITSYYQLCKTKKIYYSENLISSPCFSGNPGQITVMGQQAGGASVHYHLLSPLTRGLFNRYIW